MSVTLFLLYHLALFTLLVPGYGIFLRSLNLKRIRSREAEIV
jgi:hypothetical protein